MDIQNSLTRRSVRTHDASPVSKEDLHTILTAGMSGKNAYDESVVRWEKWQEKSPKITDLRAFWHA